MMKEDEYYYWRAACESHQLQEMFWYIKIPQQSYT